MAIPARYLTGPLAAIAALLFAALFSGCGDARLSVFGDKGPTAPAVSPAPSPSLILPPTVVPPLKLPDIAAAKTSDDARAMVEDLRAKLEAAKAQVATITEAKAQAEATVVALERAEVAAAIRRWSLITLGCGLLASAVGVFLAVYLARPPLFWLAAAGAATALCGAIGLWAAPHWVLIARLGGATVAMAALGMAAWYVRKIVFAARAGVAHGDSLETALRSAFAAEDPGFRDRFEAAVDAVSRASGAAQQSVGIQSLIQAFRGRA